VTATLAPAEPATTTSETPPAKKRTTVVVTAVAALFVFVALVLPNEPGHLAPAAFLRIPFEGLVGVALLLVLPPKARRVAATAGGALLGVLTILRLADIGFFSALDRPFDPMRDGPLLGSAVDLLASSIGRTGATIAAAVVVVLAVGVPVLMALAVGRLGRLADRYRPAATRTVVTLAVVWVALAGLGAQFEPGVPVAATTAATRLSDSAGQVRAAVRDEHVFARELATDAFRDVPGDRLLTALRGKDVVLAFVESYGRDAIEDPQYAPEVTALLDAGTSSLRALGYTSRSAFLTSPTMGGGSWLAHGTFLSGLWIDHQQRYTTLLDSDRFTLTKAFGRAGWRTVAAMPATSDEWPDGAFYGYDQIYAAKDLGYRGPNFTFNTMPDQYTMSAFQRLERDTADRTPIMAEIPLVSSHGPWSPVPKLVGWNDIGDGVVYRGMEEGGPAGADAWNRDRASMRTDYRLSIEYSLGTLISYLETYGDDDLVFLFLGDHQPAPFITGAHASRDVPITIITRDRGVLDRIAGWDWDDGLKPSPDAPVWRMNTFRDRFLTTFGP
jgi:hypothetical protein